MSRLEKTKIEKYSKKRYKTICRYIFVFVLVIITVISSFLVDYRIKNLLGSNSENNIIKYLDIF